MLNIFERQNDANLSWDSWNDDITGAVIALIRGYQDTGNIANLSAGEQSSNIAYNRGWDNTFGGATQNMQFIQWVTNGGSKQKLNLISR